MMMHPGSAPQPHDVWTAWSLEPFVLGSLALAGWLYARGLRALWRSAGRGRGIALMRARCFVGATIALAVALVSPLDALGEALFSAHMVQHLLLMLVAAPLLALSSPLIAMLWALPASTRRALLLWWRMRRRWRRTLHFFSRPLPIWIFATAVLWLWHVPALYDAAVRNEALHAIEHASFVVTAFLFWWVLAERTGQARPGYGGGLIYLFTAAMQSAGLGALLTLAAEPWYAAHERTTTPWGLTPIEDQQIAGAIMWLPPSLVYLSALALVMVLWLRTAERRARATEQRAPAWERAGEGA